MKRSLRFLNTLTAVMLSLLGVALISCGDDPVATTPINGDKAVTGIVQDETGLIVPNAVVQAMNAADQVLAVDTTDDAGAFSLASLPALDGLRMRVLHEDFKSYIEPMAGIVDGAGGPSGVMLRLNHADSCCSRLEVRVVGPSSDLGISGVEVRLRRGSRHITTARTDSNGYARFSNVCDGMFNIRVAKDGYRVVERGEIEIGECDTARVEVEMASNGSGGNQDSCCRGVLRIRPVDSASNNVIAGASVRVSRPGGPTRNVESSGEGVTIRELCRGEYQVRIAKEGYRVVEFAVTLGCNDSLNMTRTLARNVSTGGQDSCCDGTIRIIPRDSATNAVLTGASVRISRGPNMPTRTESTNGDGVTFNDLCQGVYGVRIAKEGYRVIEFELRLDCNGSATETRIIGRTGSNNGGDSCCRGVIEVDVRDSSTSAALVNATVKLWKGSQNVATLTTTANGGVRFANVCRGNHSISISREGYRAMEFNVEVGCNGAVGFTKKLVKNQTPNESCCTAVLRLRVKDSTVADGGWLSGATVTIMRGNTQVASGTTGVEGWFTREELCAPESYTVTFSKDGYRSKTFTFRFERCTTITETIRLAPN